MLLEEDNGETMIRKLIMLSVLLLMLCNSLTCAQTLEELRKNTDFAIWLGQYGGLFEVEYRAGLDPMEKEQRARFDYQYNLNERGDATSKIILDLLNFTDNAIMDVDVDAVSKLANVNETLLKLDPALGNMNWYQELMTTADVIIQCNFEKVNGTVVSRNKETHPFYVSHNNTTHSDLISGPYPEGSVPCTL